MTTLSAHVTRAIGTILTATIYNTDHVNHISNAQALNSGKAEVTVTVVGGSGLAGGGTLAADRTITADFATEAEAIAASSAVKVMSPLTAIAEIKRHKITTAASASIDTTGVDTGVVGADGGAFLLVASNGAGSGYNLQISLDGGANYTTLIAVGSSGSYVALVWAKGGLVYGINIGTSDGAITGAPTAGSGNIFFRRSAAGTATVTCTHRRFM